MSVYVKIGKKILKNPEIIRPHVKAKDISELNFKKMKEMGMEKIIFGKNNTLTNTIINKDLDLFTFICQDLFFFV